MQLALPFLTTQLATKLSIQYCIVGKGFQNMVTIPCLQKVMEIPNPLQH